MPLKNITEPQTSLKTVAIAAFFYLITGSRKICLNAASEKNMGKFEKRKNLKNYVAC